MAKLSQFRNKVNFRDLGGYATCDGRVVKPGLIFRSGGLYLLNEREKRAFKRLGMRSIMELRTTGEIEVHPDPVFEGVRTVHYSGLEFAGGEEIDFSPAGMHRLGEGAQDQYDKIRTYYLLMPFKNEAFQNLFSLLQQEEVPLVFHCASGKDRTGVAAMLVLLALGVPEKTVLEDYLLSNDYLQDDIDHALKKHAQSIAEDPLAETLTRMEVGVLKSTARWVLAAIHERYENFDEFFEAEYGLDTEALSKLRERYLMDASAYEELASALAVGKHRVRILYSSDVHGNISPFSYVDGRQSDGGLARLSTLVETLRDENTLVIDGGDSIEGSPLSSYHMRKEAHTPAPPSKAFAHIGYDFMVLGNHDFDYGKDQLLNHIKTSGAVNITGNVDMNGAPLTAPYTIVELAEKRIALVGATTHCVPKWEPAEVLEGITFRDAFEFVRASVNEIRSNKLADAVVVVYHGDFERDPYSGELWHEESDENQAFRMLSEIEGIDVLLTGHQHRCISGAAKGPGGHPVSYVQPGYKGAYLARVELSFEGDSVNVKEGLMPVVAPPDEELLALIAEEEAACQCWLDEPLGISEVALEVEDTLDAEIHKSQLVTFLNKVQMDATGAELSASSIFPKATGFPRNISMRNLVSTYTFSNTLVVKRITGAALKAYLERSAEYFALEADGSIGRSPAFAEPPQDFNYDMVDGIDYTIDLTRPVGSRIVSLTRDGFDVAPDDGFTLAVNSYRAAGGGGFPMVAECETVREYQTDMVELIARYIETHSPINFESVNNIEVRAE